MANDVFYTNIDMAGNQILNMTLQLLASDPSSPTEGRLIYNSTAHTPKVWNGTSWIVLDVAQVANGYIPLAKLATDPLARANHTGTQTASTISNFDAQVRTSRLDQLAAPTGPLLLNSQQIQGLAPGSAAGHAVEYNQFLAAVDQVRAGVRSKPAVTYVAIGNIALSGLGTQAGGDWPSAMTAGQDVLAVGQTDPKQNGPYTVAAGTWARRLADDTGAELVPGAEWFIELGTTYAASKWVLRNVSNPVVGTDNITITQTGASTAYTATNGVQIAGSVISFVPKASGGLAVDAGGAYVDATVARKYKQALGNGSATTFSVPHNLNNLSPVVSVRDTTTNAFVNPDVSATDANTLSVGFGFVPASGRFEITVLG